MAAASYHYKNSRASMRKDEPVYLSKFVTTFTLPQALQAIYGTDIITEQLNKISGIDLDKLPDMVEQHFRSASRRFAGAVVDTTSDLELEFAVNVDENLSMYPYNVFKDWSRLIYDPATALMSLKKDYCGSLKVEIHNKVGDVIRSIYWPVVFLSEKINAWDLEYNADEIFSLEIKLAAENPTDLVVGGKP